MMNLKFKPWILAGIIRHNHSLTDFRATERQLSCGLCKTWPTESGTRRDDFERGKRDFDWFSSSRDYIVQSTIKAQKSNSFESPLEFICSLTFVRAGYIFSRLFYRRFLVRYLSPSMCWHWLVTMNDPKIVVIKRNGTDGPQFPLRTNECLFGRWEKLVRRKANYFEFMKSIIAVI